MDELKEIEGSMRTNEHGQLMISNKGSFDEFFRNNPNASFTYKIEMGSNESRKRLFAYYFAEVIPKVIKGFYDHGEILTKNEAIDTMISVSSVCHDNNMSEFVIDKFPSWKRVVRKNTIDIYELNYFQLKRHIQECIIFAAENLHTVIEEPI